MVFKRRGFFRWLNGVVYIECKRVDPGWNRDRFCDEWLAALADTDLEDIYDWNLSKAVPETPN